MTVAARLTEAGFTVELNDAGGLVVAPAARLTDELRGFIRLHLATLKAELRDAANDAAEQRYRVWSVTLTGSRLTAIHPPGATHAEMMKTVRARFGEDRVVGIEPERQSEARR